VTIRKLAPVLLFTLAAAWVTAGSAAAPRALDPSRLTAPVFVVTGHGWGHGIGMSQWGAYGYAKNGFTYKQILSHYYPTTTLGPAPVRRVRVLLASGSPSLVIASEDDFKVKDADGATYDVASGKYTLKPKLTLPVDGANKPQQLTGPVTFTAGKSPLALGDRTYRGTFEISADGNKLKIVNVVSLEQYLYGVVPAEVPDDWPAEALKAQAVVARSYALSNMAGGGDFDMYADTRSQVYLGVPEEVSSTTAAVNATAGQVVLYQGKVAKTYYHSTSGGRTAAIQDVWPGETPVPYLVSVPDPYDDASPYHDWGPVAVTRERLAKLLKVQGPLMDATAVVNGSQRVTSITGVGRNGPAAPVDANTLRTALDLRSTWFTVGVLAVERPAGPVAFGKKLQLGALARGLGKVTVEQRAAGEKSWTPFSTLASRTDGVLSIAVKPKLTTAFRLVAENATSAPVRVTVSPLLKISTALDGSGLVGLARPAPAGSVIQVQRLKGTTWKSVAGARTDNTGRWTATLALKAGSYRAWIAATPGLVAGASEPLNVEP
jgi:stage II sporulation protein D